MLRRGNCFAALAAAAAEPSNFCCFLEPFSCEVQQVRGRKRNLKAGRSKAERAALRAAKEEREAARKQYSFMERTQIRRMKSLLSPSQVYPGRYAAEDEDGLPDEPTTNIYIRSAVKTQFYSISQALSFHREIQKPSMYNNPDAPIRLRLELNMTTEKATKTIPSSEELVPVPYPFKHNEKRALLAFVEDQTLQELAVEKGAEIAVGPDVVKKIIKGQFRVDDYDFCVAHTDMAPHLAPLRGILKSRCPTKLNGALGDDLEAMIEKFKNGVKVNIKIDPVYPNWGLCNVIVGKLSMEDEKIEANLAKVINAVCQHRNPALGPFINRALLMVSPGTTHFAIDIKEYVPTASEEDIEMVKKKKKKKGPVKDPAILQKTEKTPAVASSEV